MGRFKSKQIYRYACGQIIGQHGVSKKTFCWLVPRNLYHQFNYFNITAQMADRYNPLSKIALGPNQNGEVVLIKLNRVTTLNQFNQYQKRHHQNIKILGIINGTVGLINGLPTTLSNPMDQSITMVDYLQAVSTNQINEGVDLVIKDHTRDSSSENLGE